MKNITGLKRLHHMAFKTHSVEQAEAFYTGILGLPLVHTIESDFVPSTGEYDPYKHIFFKLDDNSYIAFFDLGDNKKPVIDEPAWLQHFAFLVDNIEKVDEWKTHLEECGIDVIGPTKHGTFIYSIYFFDPSGNRLEITTDIKEK